MSKQDRQIVRTAPELERRLQGGRSSEESPGGSEDALVKELNQTLQLYMARTNAEIAELKKSTSGFTPRVDVEDIEGGHRITITDVDGKESFDVMNGQDGIMTESDPTVPSWAKTPNRPVYTASDVGADAKGTAATLTTEHNTKTDAHNDIRLLIVALSERVNAIANSEDTDLDDFKEVVAYIKNNKSLIDGIASSKVNVADIIDNLATNVTDKPLSAAQGVVLKAMIDAITVPTKVSQLQNDSGYLTQHQDLSSYAKKTDIPTIPSSLPANGGNADTLDGYHIRKVTNTSDTGQIGSITFIV